MQAFFSPPPLSPSPQQPQASPGRALPACWHIFVAGVVFVFGLMGMGTNRTAPRLAALFCVLALSFLYAPLGASYLLGKAASCCTSGMCNIASHHHKQASRTHEAPMDCAHAGNRMSDCSLSCCQTPAQAAVAAHIFVLPSVIPPSQPEMLSQLATPVGPSELSRFSEPAYPPPRVPLSLFS